MDNQASVGARIIRFFKRLLITSIVLASLAATAIVMSQLNSRTYTLQSRDGKLWVLKGKMLPVGADPWRPADPVQADAYAPIELEGLLPPNVENVRYEDRDSLDRAIFSVLEAIARPRVASDDPKELEKGLACLRRAEKLPGLTEEQRLVLKKMKADVAFYTARLRLEEGQKQIEEALLQLKLAADSETKHQRAASQMLTTVEPEAKALAAALRKAIYTLSAPPPAQPAEAAKPAQPSEAHDAGAGAP